MARSQNLLFSGLSPVMSDFEHPSGEGIAVLLRNGLRERGYSVEEPDNWRDAGWAIDVNVRETHLKIALCATINPEEWMLQIAGDRPVGLLAWLFRKPEVDHSADIQRIAVAVHEILSEEEYDDLRWCWNGYPDDEPSTPSPRPWDAADQAL